MCRYQNPNSSHVSKEWVKAKESLVQKQNGKCAICGATEKLVLDHCHKTGGKRAVLCTQCNVGLGMFRDNVDTLLKAIEYLKSNEVFPNGSEGGCKPLALTRIGGSIPSASTKEEKRD